jgi:hypothetical protein
MNRLFIVSFAVLAAACSGASGSGLLDDSGTQPQDAGAPQNEAAADVATPDVTTADVVVADVVVDPPDVFVGPQDSKIQCGPQSTCSAQKEICCWHQGSTAKQFECVTSASQCAGTYDVPMTCSQADNCASQGNPGYQCCATGGNVGWGSCSGYEVASSATCKAQCDVTDYEIGCSVQQQNCADSLQTCIVSKCTVPGDTMCY